MSQARITQAVVSTDHGVDVASIDAIKVGGGTAGRMDPQGNIVQVTDPLTDHFQVRLLSQAGPMVSDELMLVDTYEEALRVADAYAAKVEEQADRIAEFRASMA